MYRVKVYAIMNGNDLPFGTAFDAPTLLSLIELAKLKGAIGVSLHSQTISGEMSFNDAEKLCLDGNLPFLNGNGHSD